VEDIKKSGNAALNLVLSPVSGVLTAAAYKDVHGIPWLRSELPIGPTGTRAFLLQVGEALGISKALVEKVLRAEESYYYSYLERIVDIYSDLDFQRYAIVAADSYYAHALTRFLANDLGWIPHLTSINDIEGEFEREEYRASFSDINSETKPIVVFEQNAGEILNRIRESWPLNRSQKYYDSLSPAYVVGSGIERDLADKLGAAFLAVAYPVSNRVVLNKGYAGYRGSLTFLEDLFTNLVAAR
jgi:nitrogenase molybdenum-iron protein beta chain